MSQVHGLQGTEVWHLYQDSKGNIWFPVKRFGVYRYDGKSFTNFRKKDGLVSDAIQSIFEDKQGRLWLGGCLGLTRYDGKSFVNVSTMGPWD